MMTIRLINGRTMITRGAAALLAAGLLAFAAGRARAEFSRGDAGTATAQFLKLGAGARAAAMGEAFAAVADDADSVYWNPAGLARVQGKSLSVMHALWLEGISYDWAAYAQPVRNIGTVGLGVQYLSYGSITEMDATGAEGGSFHPSDLAVSLGCARRIGKTSLGANLKYISSNIKNSASAFAADIGAQRAVMSGRLLLGAAVQNAGTKMKFIDQEDDLPLNVSIGGAYRIEPDWLASFDVSAPADNEPVYHAGTEYRRRINETTSAAGRLGYSTRGRETGGLNGFSAGLGIAYRGYSFDYAFVPYGDLGNTHRMSFGLNFR